MGQPQKPKMIRDRRDLKGVGTFGVDGHRKCPLSVRPGTQIVGLGAASRAVAVTCPGEPVMREFNCNPGWMHHRSAGF